MDHFQYIRGVLHCESVDVRSLAARFGTPLYVYSRRTLVEHYDRMASAFASLNPWICYSVKSCPNLAVCRVLRKRGSAFDVVSGGELARALEAGAAPERIVFAGVGKTDDEIRAGLAAGIGWFNVESEAEMEHVARLAADMGVTARVALRVNPDVDPKTHVYTTTGTRETKFGVDLERARSVFAAFDGRPSLRLDGIHLHIGSPVNTIEPFVRSITRGVALIDALRAAGHGLRAINIGGGFGAHYDGIEAPPAARYAERIVPLLAGRDLTVLLEPGRSISANAGILLTRTLYTKASGERRFVIADAAMTELLRPALYGAFHFVWPVQPGDGMIPPTRGADVRLDGTVLVDVVGPVCESGDFLARDRYLPPVSRGDLLCVFSTGAYGFAMSSQYNSRCRPAEVMVDGDDVRVIRRRETYNDLVSLERF
ncbi:MAG: diaminopimelate decarboxylase [Phycisphaerae bacterium]